MLCFFVGDSQANADSRAKVFKTPDNKAFDIVLDFTAGSVTSGSTEEIMVQVCAAAYSAALPALFYGTSC